MIFSNDHACICLLNAIHSNTYVIIIILNKYILSLSTYIYCNKVFFVFSHTLFFSFFLKKKCARYSFLLYSLKIFQSLKNQWRRGVLCIDRGELKEILFKGFMGGEEPLVNNFDKNSIVQAVGKIVIENMYVFTWFTWHCILWNEQHNSTASSLSSLKKKFFF